MRVVFFDCVTILPWLVREVARDDSRRVTEEIAEGCQRIDEACRGGMGLACTLDALSDALTHLLKAKTPFLEGSAPSFFEKKRHIAFAARRASEAIQILTPTRDHFIEARELFLALCDKDDRNTAYAQFAEYVDAALILNPPRHIEFDQVHVGHRHVKYILEKKRWPRYIMQW